MPLKYWVYIKKSTLYRTLKVQIGGLIIMAAELGFEPRQTESESAVLPLHNSAIFSFPNE